MYAKPAPAKIIIAPAKVILKVLGGGGVGEETLLQKGPSPTKHFNVTLSSEIGQNS